VRRDGDESVETDNNGQQRSPLRAMAQLRRYCGGEGRDGEKKRCVRIRGRAESLPRKRRKPVSLSLSLSLGGRTARGRGAAPLRGALVVITRKLREQADRRRRYLPLSVLLPHPWMFDPIHPRSLLIRLPRPRFLFFLPPRNGTG